MYDTKEKCRELAAKFKQLCAERGTTPYKIAQASGTVVLYGQLFSGRLQTVPRSGYPDDSLQPAGYLGQ